MNFYFNTVDGGNEVITMLESQEEAQDYANGMATRIGERVKFTEEEFDGTHSRHHADWSYSE